MLEKKVILDNVVLSPQQKEVFAVILRRQYQIEVSEKQIIILKKSLDARKKTKIVYRYRLLLKIDSQQAEKLLQNKVCQEYEEKIFSSVQKSNLQNKKIVIIGAGPAGLFAALRLIETKAQITIIEQGEAVENRLQTIEQLKQGKLNLTSNIVFGEGGAGTYSDGKLTSRGKRLEQHWFFAQLIKFGAKPAISYETKPHIGSDQLVVIMKNIREYLLSKGVEIHFRTKMTTYNEKKSGQLQVKTEQGLEFSADELILAIGHSARETYQLLKQKNIILRPKPFAMGVRIEHSAAQINEIQYGKNWQNKNLPTAEYFLTAHNKSNQRGFYTFCMCPGGEVINSSSEQNHLCVNGMSLAARQNKFSNAAVVVTVKPEDFFSDDPLAGIEFQRQYEALAFQKGGGNFVAPAQRVTSFLKGKIDQQLPENSYQPGCQAVKLNEVLPAFVCEEFSAGLRIFDRKMKGYLSEEALMIGVETRTSSPVRIERTSKLHLPGYEHLYAIGEGAGYAGGIVSSAVDGIRIADALAEKIE